MIRVCGVCFSYGKRRILEDFDLEAADGECVVIAGPNGSGKTTALSVIAGILKPSSGTVRIDGRLGYVPQGTALIEDATVGENLRFFADLSHADIPSSLPFSVSDIMRRRVSKLSGGMKKQVSIACAMIGDPDVILLDEPCASLDIGFRDEVTALIRNWRSEGRTVVYVCHDPEECYPVFDSIVFLGGTAEKYRRADMDSFAGDESSFTRFFRNKLSEIGRK